MDDVIVVERGDGPAIMGLLTAFLSHWDSLPLNVQAAIIDHASRAAFDGQGRTDGPYVVSAFVLKHRAALARKARSAKLDGSLAGRWIARCASSPRRLAATASHWFRGRRRAA